MIQEFSPDDIKEFTNMKDRFILRQIVKAGNSECANTTFTSDSDLDTSVTSKINGENDSDKFETSLGLMDLDPSSGADFYTAEKLLEKKTKNCKSTKAQMFFSNLLKDSAKEAKIWKKAPLLSQIPTSKREVFLEGIKRASPQLSNIKYQAQVWKRLGQCLQNRRKYLNDIINGKRSPRMSKMKTSTPNKIMEKSQTTMDSHLQPVQVMDSDGEDSNTNVFVVGSNVVLLDRQKRAVAKAIVMGSKDEIFTEVVVQTLLVDENETDEHLELPQACGHYTKLCKGIIKKLILWKTEKIQPAEKRIQKKKTDRPPIVNKNKTNASQCMYECSEKKKKATSAASVAGKSNPDPVTLKPQDQPIGTTDPWTYRLAVFEWSNGELYVGYQKTKRSTCSSMITNCQKPLANIRDGKLVLPKEIESSMIRLNTHDIQKNPDDDYCVFNSAHYQLDSLSNMFLIADEQAFLEHLCDGFAKYMKKD